MDLNLLCRWFWEVVAKRGQLIPMSPYWDTIDAFGNWLLEKINAPPYHRHTPLWHNSQLQEPASIPDTVLWASKGMLYLYQVLKPWKRNLPQFPETVHTMRSLSLIDIITSLEPSKLISALYNALCSPTSNLVVDRAKPWWMSDIEPLEESEWDALLEGTKLVSAKLWPSEATVYYTQSLFNSNKNI